MLLVSLPVYFVDKDCLVSLLERWDYLSKESSMHLPDLVLLFYPNVSAEHLVLLQLVAASASIPITAVSQQFLSSYMKCNPADSVANTVLLDPDITYVIIPFSSLLLQLASLAISYMVCKSSDISKF